MSPGACLQAAYGPYVSTEVSLDVQHSRSSTNSCNGSIASNADSLPAAAHGAVPPLLNLGYVLQPGTTSQTCAPEAHGTPLNSLPGHGTAPHGVSAACGAAAAAGSRANSSLCGTLSGVSEVGTSGASDASLPLSGRPSPRQVRNLAATTLCDWVVDLPSSSPDGQSAGTTPSLPEAAPGGPAHWPVAPTTPGVRLGPGCTAVPQVLPQPPAVCKPPVALPAPSGRGAMLVDAASGRLEWVQPSGPRKAGEGTEPEQQGIISFCMLPQGGALMSITLLASGFVIGPSGCSVRELARVTGADIKSWSDSFEAAPGCAARPARTFLLQGRHAAVLAAVEVAAAAVVRYKYLCEGACFGQQVPRTQVVHGIAFVYLPPPRRKVPFAAAIASAPLPRSVMPNYTPAPPPSHPQMRLNAVHAPVWPQPPQQRTLQQAVQQLYPAPQRVLRCHSMQQQSQRQQQLQQPAPPLQLQPLPGGSIWSSSAVGTTGWPTAASA